LKAITRRLRSRESVRGGIVLRTGTTPAAVVRTTTANRLSSYASGVKLSTSFVPYMISATLGLTSSNSQSSGARPRQPGGGSSIGAVIASAASQPLTAVALARENEFARSHHTDV